jgi:hypothetical protein
VSRFDEMSLPKNGALTAMAEMRGAMTADLLDRLEKYQFSCEAGHLTDCLEWVVLRARFPERCE